MNKGLKITLWVVSLGALATAVGFLIKNISKAGQSTDKKTEEDTTKAVKDNLASNETTTQNKIQSDDLPFKIKKSKTLAGSEGLKVGMLQLILNYLNSANITIDGKYGTETRDALFDYMPLTSSFSIYCSSTSRLLYSGACDIDKSTWDYLIQQIPKKGPVAQFTNYINSNTAFQNLKQKYK